VYFIACLPADKQSDEILLYLAEAQRGMLNASSEFFLQSNIDHDCFSTDMQEDRGHSTQSINALEFIVVFRSKMRVQENIYGQGWLRHLYPIRQISGGGCWAIRTLINLGDDRPVVSQTESDGRV
jgi:hypothetical protein